MILIEAVNLSKTFEGKGRKSQSVLKTVNLRVNSGERVAIVGPSGSGKSTLLHCLCGFESPTDGVVRLLGEDPQKRSRSWLARQYRESVGFVFQQFNLVSSLSAYENVVLPLRLGRRKFSKASVLSTLEQLGIRDQADSLPSQMSGGEQQRTAVARALTLSPKIGI